MLRQHLLLVQLHCSYSYHHHCLYSSISDNLLLLLLVLLLVLLIKLTFTTSLHSDPLTALPLPTAGRSTVRGHATGSHDSLGQYYTPALLASVREAYADTDYKLMASLGWWNETAISPLPP